MSSYLSVPVSLAALCVILANANAAPASMSQTCAIAGFSAEGFACCGLTPAETAAVIANVRNAEADRAVLQQRRDELQAAVMDLVLLRAGGDASDEADRSLAVALEAAAAALRSHIDTMVADCLADLPQEKRARLAAWRHNAVVQLPAALRVVAWSAEERVGLERAVRAERRAQAMGSALDPSYAAILAAARARPEVVLAEQWLDTRLASIASEFVLDD